MRPGIDTELINFKFQVMRNVPGMYSLVFISIILAYGCNPVLVPLKGKYSDRAFEITTTQSIDSVWSKLTDIFTTNGLPIKSIEKKKGTVLTVKQPINSLYTFEGKDGQLEHPQAWVVLTKVFNKKKGMEAQRYLWTVEHSNHRIRESDNNNKNRPHCDLYLFSKHIYHDGIPRTVNWKTGGTT